MHSQVMLIEFSKHSSEFKIHFNNFMMLIQDNNHLGLYWDSLLMLHIILPSQKILT